eukprot:scaffold471215_cov43-Prasinocladus_malaysianus.AAC.1
MSFVQRGSLQTTAPVSVTSRKVSLRCRTNGSRQVVTMAGHGKFFVGGNWKCNGSLSAVDQLVSELNAGSIPGDVEVVCAPPFVYLESVKSKLGPSYSVAAQNCWTGPGGAYTGE